MVSRLALVMLLLPSLGLAMPVTAPVATPMATSVATPPVRDLPDFTRLVESQVGTVVNISTTQYLTDKRGHSQAQGGLFGRLPFDELDPAFEFFRRFFPAEQADDFAQPSPQAPSSLQTRSLGSGFIISAQGHILTNAHVVADANEILVKLADKRELRARLIGADKRTDIALIKVDALALPVARLGDPAQLKVGEWVIAIGSPYGFESSVTAGIVSAKRRALPQESFVPFIQTDAAINPGNSGGPLFNMRGEVIGVNSQIYSRSGSHSGLAFAVPIDVAMDIQAQLRTHGRVVRGRIGVVMRDINKALAESFGLIKAQGVLIDAVERHGPADQAGLQPGDVVLRINNALVQHAGELQRVISGSPPGHEVQLQLWRKGRMLDVPVRVAEVLDAPPGRPVAQETAGSDASGKSAASATARLGLQFADHAALRSALRPGSARVSGTAGVSVVGVTAQGLAAAAGLRAGDVILALIARGVTHEIDQAAQLQHLLDALDATTSFTLRVKRGASQTFVSIKGQTAAW